MNGRHQLINGETGEVIVAKLEVADTFWRRFRGLQFRPPLAPDEGLLLTPCRSIHTHWMRFAIDVALLNREGLVLAVIASVRPWRVVRHVRGTCSMVESAAEQLATRIRVGDRLRVTSRDHSDDLASGATR